MKKTIFGIGFLVLAAWVLLQGNFGIPAFNFNIWPMLVVAMFAYFALENFLERDFGTGLIMAVIALIIANAVYHFLAISTGTLVLGGILACIGLNMIFKPQRIFKGRIFSTASSSSKDDIAFGLENIGMPRDEMVRKINTSLEMVRMTKFKEKEPARLSGGQKQRVAIAGMIALAPKVVILDEATSMLDPQGRYEVISTIQQLHKEKGITVISITHDLEEAASADRVLLMEGGKVNRIGTPSEIFEMGTVLVEKGLDVPFSEKLKAVLKEKGLKFFDRYYYIKNAFCGKIIY